MPDPMQALTPGSALAGQPAPPPQPGQPAPTQGQPQQQPAPPPPQQPQLTPQQQAVAARHHAIGQAASFLFGNERDPNTGEPVRQQPGAVFRSLLAGALLGGAMGSEGRASGGSVGGFLGGAARGGNAVQQQQYERQQQAQAQAQKQQEMSLEERKFSEEKIQHAATLERWNMENLAHAREADFHDREELEKEQDQEENLQKFAIASGAKLASIPHNAENGNGPTLMKSMTANPQAFAAPDGYGRLLTKSIDFTGLDHDDKTGWTEKGKPVNWADHMRWSIYYVPKNGDNNKVSMSGADWQKFYGVKGLDPIRTYNVEGVQHLVAAATSQRKNDREDFNQSFKEKHDALNATISSARTNVTQLNNEKRELIRQGFAEGDDEVKEIDDKIATEQQREQDAIGDMHPRIREVKQPGQPQAGGNTAPNKAAPNTTVSPTKGTQTHAGFTYTFNGKQWVKGQPAPAPTQ